MVCHALYGFRRDFVGILRRLIDMANGQTTAAAAAKFIQQAEARAAAVNVEQQRAAWVAENFITYDTQLLSAEATAKQIALGVELAKQAARFDATPDLPHDVRRKLDLLKLALTTPGPADPAKTAEMSRIMAELDALYGAGKYCPPGASGDDCLDVEQITKIMQTSRDPRTLLEVWRGWHSIAPAMRAPYARFVALTNEGARDLGYDDAGAMWRSKYDMAPGAFAAEVDRLWNQVKPLYDALHCYVRWNLGKAYGEDVVPPGRPIPAHLFGNIWAQEWGNVYDLVAPPDGQRGYDLTAILEARRDLDEIG